ncbi:unnamed protein product [Brassica oleracea]
MEEEKLEVEMLVEKKRWRHGYGGKHNVYGGHASGSGRGRVLCGGEGGRAGRGAVDVDQKLEGMEECLRRQVVEELMAEEEELMASVELADVDMKVVVAKEVLVQAPIRLWKVLRKDLHTTFESLISFSRLSSICFPRSVSSFVSTLTPFSINLSFRKLKKLSRTSCLCTETDENLMKTFVNLNKGGEVGGECSDRASSEWVIELPSLKQRLFFRGDFDVTGQRSASIRQNHNA